jgi:hypothetical protein
MCTKPWLPLWCISLVICIIVFFITLCVHDKGLIINLQTKNLLQLRRIKSPPWIQHFTRVQNYMISQPWLNKWKMVAKVIPFFLELPWSPTWTKLRIDSLPNTYINPFIFVTSCILVVKPFSNKNIIHGNNYLVAIKMFLEGI